MNDAMDHLQPSKRDVPQGDPRLANPFEDFEAVYPPPPCRTIQLTPEIIAQEARDRVERERKHRAGITWTPPTAGERAEPKQPIAYQFLKQTPREHQRFQRVVHPVRHCGCGAEILHNNITGMCRECYHGRNHAKTPPEVIADVMQLPEPLPMLDVLQKIDAEYTEVSE